MSSKKNKQKSCCSCNKATKDEPGITIAFSDIFYWCVIIFLMCGGAVIMYMWMDTHYVCKPLTFRSQLNENQE
jgi:hypothetical protein